MKEIMAERRKNDAIPIETKLDPRIKDVVKYNRYRDLADREVLHQAWGCELWGMERLDKISKEQRMAGDAYVYLTEAHRSVIYSHTTVFAPDEEIRARRVKRRYKESQELLMQGDFKIRRAVDELCLEERRPICFADVKRVKDGLSRLVVFFSIGRNKSGTST
jgi:hypothetical protein